MADWKSKIQSKSTGSLIRGMLICFGLMALMVPLWVRGIVRQYQSSDWPAVSASVTESEAYQRDLLKTRLRFRVLFAVGGRRVETTERRAADLSMFYTFESNGGFARDHPVGSAITVYYDPQDPKRITLSPGLSVLDFTFGGVFMPALGVAVCRIALELQRRARGGGQR